MSQLRTIEDLRAEMMKSCTSSRLVEGRCVVDTVSFQPYHSKINEDRVVTQVWELLGHKWIFLAVFDGHGGTETADYAASFLPASIRSALSLEIGAKSKGDIEKGQLLSDCVRRILETEIKAFDDRLGQAVKDIFPDPRGMTEEDIKRALKENEEPMLRAYFGSTVAGALMLLDLQSMWYFGLGDSSIIIRSEGRQDPIDTPRYKLLAKHHVLCTPQEYLTQKLRHPYKEDFVDHNRFLLGGTELTRGLGDYHYKLSGEYVRRVFRTMPSPSEGFDYTGSRNKTPPYITNDAEVGYIDLADFERPTLLLFSDGVDDIVQSLHCSPENLREVDPGLIMAQLVSPRSAPYAGDALGHAVEPRWNGPDGNRAVEVLANLLGGTDVDRLARTLDQTVLNSREASDGDPSLHIYIDDTTITVCELPF